LRKPETHRSPGALAGALAALVLCCAAQAAAAQAAAAPAGAAPSMTIGEAVASALAKDPGVISANLDYLSASAKADSAAWKRLPSMSVSASANYLGEQSATTMNLGAFSATLPAGLNHSINFGLNIQYPVFTGFRIEQSIAIAGLQAQAKDVARDSAKRSLVFDVKRAYWEAVRATYNRATLEKNLELMRQVADLATRQMGEGVATRADQLSAQMRLEQATEDLGDATSLQKRAFITLALLTGQDLASLGIATAALEAQPPFALATKPDDAALGQAASLDEAALVEAALAQRPETRAAQLARKLAERSIELSRAALYPTVALTGSASLADPSPRALVQTEKFAASGSVGLLVTYDVGGLPAALDDIKAQTLAAQKAASDEARQRNAVAMDVENCIVALERARRDLASTAAMVAQAEENLRVAEGRAAAGTAKDIDLSQSRFDLLRMEFAVTNKRIDALIAQADLARACASEATQ
jgi:outer membrane protein TolC